MNIPLVQKNPVTMVGTLDRCWLFAFRTPAEDAIRILPQVLEPVTRDGFAFWNVVISHIEAMRPVYSPRQVGVSYWHVAYRLYVRYQPSGRPPVEGLYFTRSDCDSALMTHAGNVVTDFNFHTAAIQVRETQDRLAISIDSSDAPASVALSRSTTPSLTHGSPFDSLDDAAAFLKYKPFGISVNRRGEVNIVRIKRREDAWRSRLLHVEQQDWHYFSGRDVAFEICYEVDPIAYQWNRGRIFRAG